MSTGDPDLRHPRTLCGNAETLLSVRGLMPSCRNELHLEDSELVSPVAMRGLLWDHGQPQRYASRRDNFRFPSPVM